MQVSVEKSGVLERKLTIQFPWEEVFQKEQAELKKIQRQAEIQGFRRGKAPFSIIEQRFASGVRYEVLGELMREGYTQAVIQEKLEPASFPQIIPQAVEAGKPFVFVATVEVFPEIELKPFETEVIKIDAEVTDKDIDNTIEKLRGQMRHFAVVDRACKDGDRVVIDFEGTLNDVAFEGNKAEDFSLELGSKRMIPGFEEGIMGMKSGEEKVIDVTFPEKYHAEELAGNLVKFAIKLKKVEEPVLPEVNEDFIKKYGIESGLIEDFRGELRKELSRELSIALKNKLHNEVFDKLLTLHDFEVPNALIEEEIKSMQERIKEQMQRTYGIKNPEVTDKAHLQDDAKKRVALGLLLNKLRKAMDITPDEKRVRKLVEERASMYDENEAIINAFYQNEKLLNDIKDTALEEQIVEKLLETATVKIDKKLFDEIMNR